ncbi:MAG: hypothetical protein AAFP77_30190 [Bacteroidota bacterium]
MKIDNPGALVWGAVVFMLLSFSSCVPESLPHDQVIKPEITPNLTQEKSLQFVQFENVEIQRCANTLSGLVELCDHSLLPALYFYAYKDGELYFVDHADRDEDDFTLFPISRKGGLLPPIGEGYMIFVSNTMYSSAEEASLINLCLQDGDYCTADPGTCIHRFLTDISGCILDEDAPNIPGPTNGGGL